MKHVICGWEVGIERKTVTSGNIFKTSAKTILRLTYGRGKAYATMSKVIMGNDGFAVASVNLKVFQRGGRKQQKHLYSCSFLAFLVAESP